MSVVFTDLLIELSRPLSRLEFESDPEAFLRTRALSPDEVSALLDGSSALLWRHARSTASLDPSQQFNRRGLVSDLLIEIDPMVEQHMENNDQTAVGEIGPMVVDKEGRLYIVADENLT